jgi:hypothetical protein
MDFTVTWNDSTFISRMGPVLISPNGLTAIDATSGAPTSDAASAITDPASGVTLKNLGPGNAPGSMRVEPQLEGTLFGYAPTRISPIALLGTRSSTLVGIHPGPWDDAYTVVEVDLGDGTILRTDRPADRAQMRVGRDSHAKDEWDSYLIEITHTYATLPRKVRLSVLDRSINGPSEAAYIRDLTADFDWPENP